MKDQSDQQSTIEPATHEQLVRAYAKARGDLMTVSRRITHDLRTPLGGIISTAEMLKEMAEEHDLSSGTTVSQILDSADEMGKLIERVSFMLKASLNPAPKEKVKMGDAVFRVIQRLESKIIKQNAKIAGPDSWPEVYGVQSWLEVVWWNFLKNALQHKSIQIELGWIENSGGLRFFTLDDGDGVPLERRDKLFQPFHTLHEPNGTHGLGLSIVQRLMELQEGGCGFEPRSEGGSCFYFTLPVWAKAQTG